MKKNINRNELQELYDSNADFREYVDKYRTRENKTIAETLKDALVWEKAKDIVRIAYELGFNPYQE